MFWLSMREDIIEHRLELSTRSLKNTRIQFTRENHITMGLDLNISTTLLNERSDYNLEKHFRWDSIKKFIYIAYTYSSTFHNFDIFSKVLQDRVLFSEFILLEITMGMGYMFMDVFIKQYTRRMDLNQSLNPLLKGINFGCVLQSLMWNIILAGDLADSIRMFFAALSVVPYWSTCDKTTLVTCVPTYRIILTCRKNIMTDLNLTSAHFHYQTSFSSSDRSDLSTRLFVITLVWILNFVIATVTDAFLIKILRILSLWRVCTTIFVLVFVILYSEYYFKTAVGQMFDITVPRDYSSAIDRITFVFGIGLVGVYDFGTMSPRTMVDNAVVIFATFFTAIALARSMIVRVLYFAMTTCVRHNVPANSRYLIFVLMPLSSDFMHAQKVFTVFIYANVVCSTVTYLAMLTLTISKLIHNEFRSVKIVYMVGILCFLCCNLSYPVAMISENKISGIIQGLNLTVLYLGGVKVAIVMWLYGVKKFSTDIQFSLGFKPTQFWTASWTMLPILAFAFVIHKIYVLFNMTEKVQMILASAWIMFSFCAVTLIQIKTVAKYIVRNNLAGILKSSPKYGPPDAEERLRRRNFNVELLHRKCIHQCSVLDEKCECNHMPLTFKEKSRFSSNSNLSLTNIYQAGGSGKKSSVVIDSSQLHLN